RPGPGLLHPRPGDRPVQEPADRHGAAELAEQFAAGPLAGREIRAVQKGVAVGLGHSAAMILVGDRDPPYSSRSGHCDIRLDRTEWLGCSRGPARAYQAMP